MGVIMKESKKYYRDIKKIFPIHGKREKQFLNSLKEQIVEYENENNNCTFKDLENVFGSPIEIVVSYYQSINNDYLLKKINMKRLLRFTCIIIISLVLIIFVWKIALYNQGYHDFHNNIPIEYEETIEESD